MFVVSLGMGGLAWAGEAEDAFKEGARLLSAAKLREAVPYFDKAIELNPKNARAYGDRGIAQLLLWKDTEAQKDFAKCFELDQGMRKVFELLIEKANAKHAGKPP